ncbi:hypothetical protein GQX73_g1780 [Xylaria multiplex]|uniref:Major facilitator superfamily (MFS) profile domain-containing protein n=1 Tax=Xylaria multiplex TaxID=323545 RepID=A0A7C8N2U0_9PEZI|nr:hypothetical protein GQX73_g1780 [Xylaria multiplex]
MNAITDTEDDAASDGQKHQPLGLEFLEVEDNVPISYDDPRDTRNPRNWSLASRIFHTVVPGLLAFEITFSTSVTVPATTLIMKEFDVSRTQSLLPLTLYTFGLAVGPLFVAPFSEVFGRKWVYVVTSTFLLAFIGGASAANTFSALLACRFLAGALGSAGIAIGAGSITDVWRLDKTGASDASLLFILSPFLGPTLGPLAGAYILHDTDNWRWTQYLLLIVGAPIWIGCILMKETSRHWILRHEAKADSIPTWRNLAGIIKTAFIRPTKMLFTEVVVSSLAIYAAFVYAMIFSYFGSASYIFQRFYGFNLREVGLSFISVIIGYVIGMFIYMVFDHTLCDRARRASPDGRMDPEHRLYTAFIGSAFLPVALFWYAWEAHDGGYWPSLVAAGIPFGIGAFSLFLSIITYSVDFYGPRVAASALAANGLLRYTLGAVFPLFTIQMYENLGVHWAGSVTVAS